MRYLLLPIKKCFDFPFILAVVFFFSLLSLVTFIFPQKAEALYTNNNWVHTLGGASNDYGFFVDTDSSGNIYLSGRYNGTSIDFDDTAGTDTFTSNSGDPFITKFNSSGTYQWTKTIYGSSSTEDLTKVKIDSNNNIFGLGFFSGTNIDFDPNAGSTLASSNGSADIFIWKLNSSGNLQYVRTFGGSLLDGPGTIVIDSSDNIIVVGFFQGINVDFDGTGGTDSHSSVGDRDIFVTKYYNNGSYAWTKTFGSTGIDQASAIDIDNSDNIIISGSFAGTIDFDPGVGTANLTSTGSTSLVIAKYDTNGNYIWANSIGGSGSTTISSVGGLRTDTNNNIFVAGGFSGINFDFDGAGGGPNYSSVASEDGYLVKYTASGSFGWVRVFGATVFNRNYLDIDENNNVLSTGYFSGTVDFDGTAGTDNKTSTGGLDLFVSKYDNNGDYYWTRTSGDIADDWGLSIKALSNNDFILSGGFHNTVDFDFSAVTNNKTSNGGYDAFVSKYHYASQISNLSSSLDVKDNSANSYEDGSSTNSTRSELVNLYDNDSGLLISRVYTDLRTDRSWSSVTGDSDLASSKSVVANLVTAPGAASTHTLYIPKLTGQNGVYICPSATTLSQVSMSCAEGYMLTLSSANVSIVNVGGQDYWKVEGMTGTGGMGVYNTGVGFTLTPNFDGVSETQEVTMSYTATGGFVAGDQIVITWESAAGLTLANTCATPTTDADTDSTVDGSGSISSNQYTYTFTASTTQSDIALCVNVTAYSTQGSYSVVMNDDNSAFGAALYYVGGDNQVFVITNIAPSLSFNIRNLSDSADTNICDLGTVSPSTASPNGDSVDDGAGECGYSLAIGTNAQGGFQAQIDADGVLNNASSSIVDIVEDGTIAGGVEGYGIDNITPATTGRNTVTGLYNVTITEDGNFNDDDTPVPTSATNFVSYSDGIQYIAGGLSTDVTKVMHGLGVNSGTPSGYYDQIVTYTVTATF